MRSMGARSATGAAALLDGAHGGGDVQLGESNGGDGERGRGGVALEALLQHEQRLARARLVGAAVERGDDEEVPELANRLRGLPGVAQPLLEGQAIEARAVVRPQPADREEARTICAFCRHERWR